MPLNKLQEESVKIDMQEVDIHGVVIADFDEDGINTKFLGKNENGTEITSETQFGAASLSKLVFAYLVNEIANDPQYDFTLDTKLHEILEDPNIKNDPNSHMLTARLILSHQSGWTETSKIKYSPGEHFFYTGIPFAYLQRVIEEVTDMSLEVCVEKYVFTPLLMNDTRFIPAEGDKHIHPAKDLFTTAHDYALFCQVAFKKEELFKSIVDLSTENDNWAANQGLTEQQLQKISWGLGWGLQKDEANKTAYAFHHGDMGPWRAFVALDLVKKSGVVYFANSPNGLLLADKIIKPFVNLDVGLDYIFKKFGFARKIEPNWQEKQNNRINGIIQKNMPELWEEISKQSSEKKCQQDTKKDISPTRTSSSFFSDADKTEDKNKIQPPNFTYKKIHN